MCGRYTLTTTDLEALADQLGAGISRARTQPYRPRYNVAPTDPCFIVRRPWTGDLPAPGEPGWPAPQRVLVPAKWGLVNHWAKDAKDAAKKINARHEGLHGRPAFKQALLRHRCLVPADGFFEWKRQGKQKQPLWFHRPDGHPFVFAGLYDRWFPPTPDGSEPAEQLTFTILTRAAGPEVKDVHDRMPVILPGREVPGAEDLWEAWLGSADLARPEDLETLLAAFESTRQPLEVTPVSSRVGSVKNDDPTLIVPLTDAALPPAPAPEPAPKADGTKKRQLRLFE
jgi:putative SOS response-associated peptidase YedK